MSKFKLTKVYIHPNTGWNCRLPIYENNTEKLDITFIGDKLYTIGDTKYKIAKSTDITIKSLVNEAKKPTK